MGGKWGAISKLHAFPKAEDHLTQKTLSGAIGTYFPGSVPRTCSPTKPKADDHLAQKTVSGAIVTSMCTVALVTLLGVAIMVVLFAHKLSFVLTPE
ncbi:unnamed protein product, partial [Closterium sp. Naga37s-1]